MKKLLMIIAVGALALSASAATTSWAFYNASGTFKDGYVKLSGGTPAALSTTVYCIYAGDVSQANLLEGLRKGTYTQDSVVSLAKTSGATSNSGNLPNGVANKFEMEADVGTSYAFYEVAFASTDAGDFVYLSGSASSKAQDTGKDGSVGISVGNSTNYKDINTEFGSGAWYQYSESIPEPTSAMMIMLGLAGLALRRKQK